MSALLHLDQRGYVMLPKVLSASECAAIENHLAAESSAASGARSLLQRPWCAELVHQLRQSQALLGAGMPASHVATQCTLFEKSSEHNWLVPLHQDLSICVAARVDHAPLTGWSIKEGLHFVQANDDLLAQLVAVRVHIDPCAASDGALRVQPASHLLGRIKSSDIYAAKQLAITQNQNEERCVAAAGDVLLMRPLLLHASSKSAATSVSRRRVLHFLFGPPQLQYGLRWHLAI